MKIILDIPDNLIDSQNERNLYLFAGMEMIAFKTRGDKWKIKTKGCLMCGECCKHLTKRHPFPVIDDKCIHLINPPGYGDKWICGLGIYRPFACAISNSKEKYCKVKYEYKKE